MSNSKEKVAEKRKLGDTLCWNCKGGSRCSWEREFKPVEGWEAIPTKVNMLGKRKGPEESFCVKSCPLYEEYIHKEHKHEVNTVNNKDSSKKITYKPEVCCPKCGGSSVNLCTKHYVDFIYRRRECKNCGNRFSTAESIEGGQEYLIELKKAGNERSVCYVQGRQLRKKK